MQLNAYIDHTILKPTATQADIAQLCQEAIAHGFYAVCVNGCWVDLAKKLLSKSEVKLAAVVGFPLGAMHTDVKVFEALKAVSDGADEIDMVINIAWAKQADWQAVTQEIDTIKKAIGEKILKVIIETCYLTDAEIISAAKACLEAKADFVKTSTGFGTKGATLEDVKRIKDTIGNRAQIKASGGIKDKETALKFLSLGVSRLGTSSGVDLVQ
ncbi:MAG: deoxyribose-phosphate aldolase [Bacteroidetes bacterium]|nr:deoxyribose-phosphate aldolase [Bacteroidota bacterium]